MNDSVVLVGNLNFLCLGDILQVLGSNGASGVLRIKSRYSPEPGLMYFSKGDIINASDGSMTGLDAAYSLFGWTEGEFEFREEKVKSKRVINTNRMEIILDGLRKLDEGEIKKLGPVSFEEKPSDSLDKATAIPVIKGPLVDHEYVVDVEDYFDGQKIVREKKYGSWIWVILKGVAEVVKETAEGPISILRIGEGSFIGGMSSFSFSSNVRSATVVAMGDVQLGVLDTQRLSERLSKLSPEFRGLIASLDRRLKHVTDRAVEVYLKKNRLKEFTENRKPIIEQGGSKETLSILTQGEVSIVRNTSNGHLLLANLGKGDFVGHIPFLSIGHEPHSASAFASADFESETVNSASLQKEYDELPPTFKNILENLTICISLTTRVACDFRKKIVQKKPN
ncbi:MAG: cyclic nucleotide-binding domain-containing protein [Thermodesulfobacteriota bacterium]|nr:cyclic nucleotide-binding domain-containing protein [Thermodesulfobacteriota bacterium]